MHSGLSPLDRNRHARAPQRRDAWYGQPLRLAERFSLTLYDAAYLELAHPPAASVRLQLTFLFPR
jgi:hypothetical protein